MKHGKHGTKQRRRLVRNPYVLVRQGCNFVIGVDVSAHIQYRVGDNFPKTPTEQMKTPGVLATLLRCFNVQAHNMSRVGAQRADVTITPDVSMFKSSALTQTAEMADIGYRAKKRNVAVDQGVSAESR